MPQRVRLFAGIRLDEEELGRIAAVSSEVEVSHGYEPLRAERARLSARGGRGEDLDGVAPELKGLLGQSEVLLLDRCPASIFALAPRARWIQLTTTGADAILGIAPKDIPIPVTVARGVPAPAIAEFVLMAMLVAAKRAPRFLASQRERRWERRLPMTELRGKTVGLLGLGAIGSEVARLAKAFGMRVLATRRSAQGRVRDADGVDEIFPPQRLGEMLKDCDFFVVAAPLTAETREMVGEAELRQMKPTAFLVNIARGEIVDEAALIRALRENWIAGAALDVFAEEPLPEESPLWSLDNVVISPHVAGTSDMTRGRFLDLFCENLRRYLSREPLLNVVDAERGY